MLTSGHMPLEWFVASSARFDQSGFTVAGRCKWLTCGTCSSCYPTFHVDALQPLEVQRVWLDRNTCVQMAVLNELLGIREGLLDHLMSHNLPGKENTSILNDLPRTTISFVFKKSMGRMKSCRLFRFWSHNFDYGTFLHPQGSVACRGQDTVSIQSGDCN